MFPVDAADEMYAGAQRTCSSGEELLWYQIIISVERAWSMPTKLPIISV